MLPSTSSGKKSRLNGSNSDWSGSEKGNELTDSNEKSQRFASGGTEMTTVSEDRPMTRMRAAVESAPSAIAVGLIVATIMSTAIALVIVLQ